MPDRAVVTPAGVFLPEHAYNRLMAITPRAPAFPGPSPISPLMGLSVFRLPSPPLRYRRHPFNKLIDARRHHG